MIDKTLAFLLDELNRFLAPRGPGGEPPAVLSSLTSGDGAMPAGIDNKLVLTLLSIEKEGAAANAALAVRDRSASDAGAAGSPAGFSRVAAALPLNLNIVVSASFGSQYREALKMLSAAIAFFQARPLFSPQNAPGLPAGIDRLSIELVSCDLAMLGNVWTILGANALPCAMYKVRMLSVQQGWASAYDPAVGGAETDVGTR